MQEEYNQQPQTLISASPYRLITTAIVLSVIIAGVAYYFGLINRKESATSGEIAAYTIQSVPYYGFINNYVEVYDPVVASVMSVLGYWGDDRFTSSDLIDALGGLSPQSASVKFLQFFSSSGYNTSYSASGDPSDELKYIKNFINAEQHAPVIVLQKFSNNNRFDGAAMRVVIGFDDKEKVVIAHDFYKGMARKIPYNEFLDLFAEHARVFFTAIPSKNLQEQLSRSVSITGYDDSLQLPEAYFGLVDHLAEGWYRGVWDDFLDAAQEYKQAVNSTSFELLPRAYRIVVYDTLGRYLLSANSANEAISLIKENVLPLNNNLDEMHNVFTGQNNFFKTFPSDEKKFANPFVVLARAHIKKEQFTEARAELERALEIWPNMPEAKNLIKSLP